MTDKERQELAREEAKAIVARLRESNESAAKNGAATIDEAQYKGLEKTMARKLMRA